MYNMGIVTFRVKNMVCPRCIKVVRECLQAMNFEVVDIQLGQVLIKIQEGGVNMTAVKQCLENEGFELLEDKDTVLIEQVKISVIELIHSGAIERLKSKFSDYLALTLQKDYHTISIAFSTVEGITLEKYFILQKIERAKELLSYGEMQLGALAHKLGYSSIAHFSNQFKQITGGSPTAFRKKSIMQQNRKSIAQVK